ncbi:hypothetical protein DIJ64_01495 [Mycobacterium leprae]|uniref:Uncharacterized protein n=1 Tax=Mycobacterium leprae TaxID=1769 RepID=A0AAD0P7R4_MYCLR|nr:hypothetical protein DIJ64_01495 [Mycobacterium leprae]OAR20123.1 hypothetical protein A8144_12135 [Mycobacterium leprae 3125609]OAX70531.1 hypothetical protein A3216_11375 [Mycobacterium leprae 7935681]
MLPSAAPAIIEQYDSDSPHTGIALASLVGRGMTGLAVRGLLPIDPCTDDPTWEPLGRLRISHIQLYAALVVLPTLSDVPALWCRRRTNNRLAKNTSLGLPGE